MNIINVNINELTAYENNPRHNQGAVNQVAKSITEFGFKVPIIIDKDNVIITGHTRVLAAEKLGMKTVPTIVAEDLTDEQVKAFRIADNRTGENAHWDIEKLNEELEKVKDLFTGFDMAEVDMFLSVEEADKMLDEYKPPTKTIYICPECGHEAAQDKFKHTVEKEIE